ncbi:ARF/SAR superfamily [Pelomyxa schiedti]|nr:ARF/SAR superfamily [Pelomyxa schiedti]
MTTVTLADSCSILSLPLVLVQEVALRLDARSLCRFSQTCRALHSALSDNALWKQVFIQHDWGWFFLAVLREKVTLDKYDGDWKSLYAKAYKRTSPLQNGRFCSSPIVGRVVDWGTFYKAISWLFPKREQKIFMSGLGGAGKTTFLYKLSRTYCRSDDLIISIPTIGFCIENLSMRNIDFTCTDCEDGHCHCTSCLSSALKNHDIARAKKKFSAAWAPIFENSKAIIFVVDCAAEDDYLYITREYLYRFCLDDHFASVPLLILANKIDLPNARTEANLYSLLELSLLNLLAPTRPWVLLPCCATSGQGIKEALEWLSAVLD